MARKSEQSFLPRKKVDYYRSIECDQPTAVKLVLGRLRQAFEPIGAVFGQSNAYHQGRDDARDAARHAKSHRQELFANHL